MPLVDVADETFVVADARAVASHVAQPQRWAAWFPGLALVPIEDRGESGMRWSVTGELQGTAEVWVEVVGDGVVLHTFLRGDPAASLSPAKARATVVHWALVAKRVAFSVKDSLEAGRTIGAARA